MNAPVRYEVIDGVRYKFRDLGCDDLDAAALNRKRVKEGYGDAWWIQLESSLEQVEQREIAGIIRVRRRR